jgi:transposase-like protein
MESLTVQRRPRVSAEERAQWVARYHASQLSTRQFAQQQGLKDGTLQRWIREERRPSPTASEATRFQEVHVSGFASAGAWAAEVLLPGGMVVRLGATASATWMRSLWASLQSSC